ncbi:phage tail spike protein [Leuconostoc pseudomesenteroides]|uniref:phage tail spike protein n=1 Tax=Leuconostoc pseudomesenteroides TaxID=33968 RepID=UPI0039E95770
MIYIFDKKQAIIKVLTNDDFTAAHLNFKINTATTFGFSLPASKALPSGSKYVATPHPLNDSKFIMLRLTERVDNTETIDYSAYELAYQELATDGYIEDKRPSDTDAKTLMQIALNGTNWELNNVNVAGTAKTNFYYTDHLSAISNVVDLLGGEIVFYIEIQGNTISGRYMDYLARQGADTSKVFASGSNLLTVERQSDTSNIYTAILPRGKGEEIDNGDANTPDGYGRRINIADVEWKKSSGKPLDKPKGSIVLSDPDATAEWGQINGNARLLLQTYDDIDDVNVLINSAYKTLQSVNHPQIQYSATVADVGGLSLGDTVLIMHGDRDLSYKTRVFEVKYDLLAPDQTELSLGDDLSSNSITSQINSLNAVADTTSSQTQWTINQIGRPSTTFGNTEPANPKVGDVFFKELPDGGTEIYRWDGDIWELLASPTTADDIAAGVTDAVSQAKAHTDEVKQGLSSDIITAKSQAASQANVAEVNAKSAATSQFNQAQNALSAAKTDLTNSIASEASARSAAVAAANSQAQTYANQAKSDAMSAASSADGVINKKIDDTASSISSTISQNKIDADGKISTAQTTAQQAVDGLKTKVSQTDYNAKTGQLQTDLTATTQTANQAKTDIVSIKQTDTSQDARMTQIESDASGVKTTVSNLQTAQGKQSGDISTLQQRADGFDATVTKVNNLSVGGRNYVLNTNVSTTGNILGFYSSVPSSYFNHKKLTVSVQVDYDNITALSAQKRLGVEFVILNKDGSNRYIGSWKYPAVGDSFHGRISTTWDFSNNEFKDYADNLMGGGIYVQGITGTNVSVSKPKLEIGTQATDLTPAPEDVDSATAKAQLTADNATLSINNYKTDTNGIISKAQADIKANADAITQKVSQTDYDKKTGDLTTAVSKAQTTADGAVTTVGNYKASNDNRVSAAESKIEQNSKDITARVTQTDYDNNNSQLNTRFTKVEATANGASATVSDLNGKVNNLGQLNRLLNTEFNPDYAAWTTYGNAVTLSIDRYWLQNGSNNLGVNRDQDQSNWGYATQKIAIGQNTTFSFSVNAKINSMISSKGRLYIHLRALDVNGNAISDIYKSADKSTTVNFERFSIQNAQTPAGTTTVELAMGMYGGGSVSFNHPFFVLDSHLGNYVAGNYSNSDYLAQVKITADTISNFVRDSSGNISSDFQTALSKTSIITGSTLASSIKTQTSSQISSAITDNNGKIISLINQDSSGVQIAGKNLAITADTTVDGNFWAKQVNAIKVNATNITAGTLNASDVNIINLDVNSLTGNITNFIQSNWNGKYQSTEITSDGMQIGGFTANGFDTIFDKTGITFETTDARYGYAIAHYGTDSIKNSSGTVMARGMEIRTGNENGIGFDYFAIKSPGANNLELGKTTNAGHISIAVVPDTNLMPILNKGVTILDDLYVGKVNGAKAGGLFSVLAGRTIHIPTSMNNNGTVGGWLDITL